MKLFGMRNRSFGAWLIVGAAGGVLSALGPARAQNAGDPPASDGKSDVREAAPPRNADELLNALEHADADLRSLSAQIRYDRTFELQGDRQTRTGRLVFDAGRDDAPPAGSGIQPREPRRKFGILFDTLKVGDRLEQNPQHFIFDGEWLIEKEPAHKQAQKRQVVPPGEKFDPLRIGEGPFPIPIGQKRDDILSRYNAELVPMDDGIAEDPDLVAFASRLGTAWQLRLVPLPERAATDEFQEVRLWYIGEGKDRLLPRMARTVSRGGDVSVVQLINVEKNAPIDPALLDTTTPEGWDVQVTHWREPAAGSGGGDGQGKVESAPPGEPGK